MATENDFLPATESAVDVRVPRTKESGDILRSNNPIAKNTEWQKHSGVMVSITDYQPTITPETVKEANISQEDTERQIYTGALSAPGAIGYRGEFWNNVGKGVLDAAQDLPIVGVMFGERGTYKAQQTLGATIIDATPDGKSQEYGRKIAAQASRQLQLMRERDGFTDEEADSWGAAIGSGTVSMAEFVAASAMTGGSQIIPSVLAGIQGYSEGAGRDVEKYIEETGDVNLENYQGSVGNLATNVASGAVQGAIEGLIGKGGRILDTGKIATGNAYTTFLARWFAESGANALEEKLQTITGETAELIKGNSDLKEWFVNSLTDWKDAGVGALLGGTMSLTGYNNSHIKGVNKLKNKIQELYPDVQPAAAERAAEDMMNAGETAVVQGASKNIDAVVAIADPNSELTAIVKKATLDTINAKIKESDGFADGDMTEEQRLQFADTFTKVLVSDALRESVEQGIPLTETPLMKAVGGTDGLFLSGRDYSALNEYLAEKIDDTRRARWYKAGKTTAESYAAFRETERVNAQMALDNELKRIEKEIKIEQEKHRKDMEKLANQIADARIKAEQRRMAKDMRELTRLSDKRKADEAKYNARMEKLAERQAKMNARKEKAITAQQRINDIRKASRDDLATFVNKIYGYQTRSLTDQALVELAINQNQRWEIKPKKKTGTQESIEQAEKAKRDRTRASTIKRVLEQDARDLASFTGVPESVIERMTDDEYKNFVDNASRLRRERAMLIQQAAEIDEAALEEIDFNLFQSKAQNPLDLAPENARLDAENPEYTGDTIKIGGETVAPREASINYEGFRKEIKDILKIKAVNDWVANVHKERNLKFTAIRGDWDLDIKNKIYKSPSYGRQSSEYYVGIYKGKPVYVRKSNHWGIFHTNTTTTNRTIEDVAEMFDNDYEYYKVKDIVSREKLANPASLTESEKQALFDKFDSMGDQFGRVGFRTFDWELENGKRRKDGQYANTSQVGIIEIPQELFGTERTVYNSNGDRIAKSEPALRNFWAWFGDSKVVDDKGRPLVVYHGTSSEFDTFDIDQSGKNTGTAIYGKGFYFTTNKDVATKWGQKRGEPIVMSAYVKLENPNMVEELSYPKDSQEKGFDGVIAKVWGEKDLEIVAFESNQIKSTENKGTFSPDTGDIYYQSSTSAGLKGKDDYRASYDPILDRILLGDNWDATSMMHEIAHRQAQRIYHAVHSGQASPELEKRWLAIEEWLGMPESYWKSHDFLGRQYQEQFARAYEKFIYDGKYANPELKTLFKDLNRQFVEIYEDLNDKYFDLKKELSPELLELFNRVQNIEINEAIAQNSPEALVDKGVISESQAVELSSEIDASQAIDSLIAADNKTQGVPETNDITVFNTGKTIKSETATKFEEKTGIETDKERGRREVFAKVKPAARDFVLNNESLAFDIVSGKAPEQGGLFRQDLYKALEAYYTENDDINGLMSLSSYTKIIGQEASARMSGLRNADGTNFLETLDAINNKIEKKNEKQIEKETNRLESELDKVAFDWDESIDEQFMKSQECK